MKEVGDCRNGDGMEGRAMLKDLGQYPKIGRKPLNIFFFLQGRMREELGR